MIRLPLLCRSGHAYSARRLCRTRVVFIAIALSDRRAVDPTLALGATPCEMIERIRFRLHRTFHETAVR